MIEQSSRLLKIVLSLLLIVLSALFFFLFLMQKESKQVPTVSVPVVTDSSSTIETASSSEVPSFKPVSSYLSPEEIEQQLKAVQDQVDAGTLSIGEGQKQKDAIGVRITPPAGIKK